MKDINDKKFMNLYDLKVSLSKNFSNKIKFENPNIKAEVI